MNEVSNGPSGNMEYVEFVVSDTTIVYNCSGITNPPCIDIRGWIFDDNSGYHGAGGVAPGCIRFSNNIFWSCMPVGTIILIYNNLDPNSSLPPIDTLMSDGNCRLVVPVNKTNWFDQNPTTPGALACSYPAAGWIPSGLWSNTLLANTGDCARIVNLAGCEIFSVCWGTVNTNTLIYFPGSAQDRVYYFDNSTNNDPTNQANWVNGCADPVACGSNTQTPGSPNNTANAAWINSMNNNCTPIPALTASVNSTNGSCPCTASASVSASGSIPPYSYTWTPTPSSGQGTSNASGLCSGTFTCFIESIPTGCIQSITVSVSNGTVGTTATNTGSYCSGSIIQLNTPAATSYTWSGPGGFSSSVQNPTISPSTPTMSGTYTVSAMIGSCLTTATTGVLVNTTPTITVNSTSLCSGQNATLTAGGATSYTWNTGPNTSMIIVSPTVTTNYTISGSASGCSNSTTTSVLVNPTPTVSVNSPTLCVGQNTILTASGASTFTWNTGPTTATISISPTVTTNYTVTGSSGAGCTNTTITTVSVNPNPTITVNSASLCSGQTTTLTASGATSYTWNTGPNTSVIIISPTITTNYTVSGSALGCSNSLTTSVIVNPNPTVTINSPTLCVGQNTVLTASGASTYTWSTGPTTVTISVSPTVTTNYTVIGSNSANCTSTAITSVSVNPNPTITVNSALLCSGQSATLTAGGATSYSWSTGPNTSVIIVIPTVTTNYTVSGSNAGCSGSAISAVSVTPSPTLSPVSVTICPGNTATLSVSGASNYTWNSGSITGPTYTTSPLSNTTYTIIGANGTCTTAATASVTIGTGISIGVNSPSICIGQSVTLTASGATTYTWSTGANTASISVNPTVTTTYTIDGVNGLCNGTNTTIVTVNPLPIITPVPTVSICSGQTATLTASGAVSYTWNPGLLSSSSVTVSPPMNQSYTVTGSDANGCANIAITNVSVTPNPTISVPSQTICSGQTATLSASGASSYTWIPGSNNTTTLTVSPVSSSVYTITGSVGSCSSAITSSVEVISSLTLTVNSPTICMGQSTTLNASGATTYSWAGGPNTSTFAVTPTITTNYSFTGSIGTCTNSISTFVTVNNLPASPIAQTNSIVCEGQTIMLNGSGSAGTFSWSGPSGFNSSTASATINPATSANSGTYTLTVTDASNCSNSSQTTISVNPLPMATVSSPTTCLGNDLILNSSGGIIYAWAGPNNFNSGNQNVTIPSSSTNMAGTYTLMVTDVQGCTSARTIDIIVDKCQCPVFIPEGFSPNSDGAHDLFVISCITDRPTKVEIYNRWGNLVYKNDDYKNDWGGKNNTGLKVVEEDLPAGTYYYIIKISDEDKSRTGFVTLWR